MVKALIFMGTIGIAYATGIAVGRIISQRNSDDEDVKTSIIRIQQKIIKDFLDMNDKKTEA